MTDISWRKVYKTKTVNVDEIANLIPDGSTVFVGTGAGEPLEIIRNLESEVESKGLNLLYGWSLRKPVSVSENYLPKPSYFCITNPQYSAYVNGNANSIPAHISDIPKNFRLKIPQIDVAVIMVGPPDPHGNVSLGVSVDITAQAIKESDIVIAQVNGYMPRTYGDSFLSISDIDYFIPHTEHLPEIFPPDIDSEVETLIGIHISNLIPDGSTIHIGQGKVPLATVRQCFSKKNLGVHSLMISDWVMELINAGAIDNSRKEINRSKVTAGFALGTSRFYEYINDNAKFEMKSAEYLGDSRIISRYSKFISLNGAGRLDISGQVAGDHEKEDFLSTIGGIGEMSLNVSRSSSGHSILALPSRDILGNSNIRPYLEAGERIILRQNDVDYIVTEYGYARVKGLSVKDRAVAIANLAHPNFRNELMSSARKRKIIPAPYNLPYDQNRAENIYEFSISESSKHESIVTIRTAYFSDLHSIGRVFYSLTKSELDFRFFGAKKNVREYLYKSFKKPEYKILIAFINKNDISYPCGVVEWVTKKDTAEMAIAVSPEYRYKGIATHLLKVLEERARKQKISRISAEVLVQNSSIIRLLSKSSQPWEKKVLENSIQFILNIAI